MNHDIGCLILICFMTIVFMTFYQWHISQSFVTWLASPHFYKQSNLTLMTGSGFFVYVPGFVFYCEPHARQLPHNHYQLHRRQSLDAARCVASVMQFRSLLPRWACPHQTIFVRYYSDVHYLNCSEPLLCWSIWMRGYEWNARAYLQILC